MYLYVAVIFGGAFIAMVYFRAQDRSWPSTIVFFGVLTVVSVVSVYRAQKKKGAEGRRGFGERSRRITAYGAAA
ncbi:hypothetical protein KDN32_04820 [Nocardioides sp. J2M5]|uniref:hypothetical protein n=1 Tax=Nocardioides palaemonis TaxID=2829810 RepID=UPI001BACF616|nr:hypothetical protein [Nocardioides palaemonis]MBS2937064.1 hypothetical protein [Nocardioides palaemonis]